MAFNTKLLLGDCIHVSFKFGHNTAKKDEPENWVDVHVQGVYKVLKILPDCEMNTIELCVKEVKEH
jgi:hypothetical protein